MSIPTSEQTPYWAVKFEDGYLYYNLKDTLGRTGPVLFNDEEAAYKWIQTNPQFVNTIPPPEPTRIYIIIEENPPE